MSSDIISFQEVFAILRRHVLKTILICTLGVGAGIGGYYLVPKKFKSRAVINIQAAYFQIPLVGDLVGGGSDSVENKAQREALLRQALNNDFLDELGEKYKMFRYSTKDRRHMGERESLFNRIEYFGIGSNSYQISVSARYAELAYKLTEEVINQMIATLISERLNKLNRARVAIQSNIDALKVELAKGAISPQKPDHSALESLEVEQAKLTELEQKYTSQHPNVVQQRSRVDRLRSKHKTRDFLKNSHIDVGKLPPIDRDNSIAASQRALQDLHDDLFRRYNYLNIVSDMEKSPDHYPYVSILEQPAIPSAATFPKKPIFAIAGFALGFVISLLWMIFSELRRGTFASPTHISHILEAPFLGSLPPWISSSSTKKALPAPPPG